MIKIEKIEIHTIPYYGNKRNQPYGYLTISDGNTIEDAAERLKKAGYKYEIQSDNALMVFYKGNSIDHTQISICNDSRYGYYMIEGKVQNIVNWINRE